MKESTEEHTVSTLDEVIEEIFSSLEEQRQELNEALEAFKITTREMKENTEAQTASTLTEAIEKIFSSLEEQRQELNEALEAFKIATHEMKESTKEHTVSTLAEVIEEIFSSLEEQRQELNEALEAFKIATHEMKENTETQTTSTLTKAIEEMFSLFGEEKQELRGAFEAVKTATREMIENTEKQNTLTRAQVIENMQLEISRLSDEEKKKFRETLEVIEVESRKVAENVVEGVVEQKFSSLKDQEIKKMEQKYTNLLEAGLRTIISAAIEAATISTNGNENIATREEMINRAKTAAVEAAGEIVFGHEDQTPDDMNGHFPSEKCHWTNKDYTVRLVKEYRFFPLSDPLKTMLESWGNFQEKTKRIKIAEEMGTCGNPSHNGLRFPMEDDRGESPGCIPGKEQNIDDEKSLEDEFAYLSYDEFILAFFQESIKDTNLSESNDVPLECFFASAIRGASLYNPGNFYYCEKDSNRPGNMSVTDENNDKKVILPRRACLNRDYIYLTAIAFNKTADCFGFDKSQKEKIFKLFNHESSFLHNIKGSKRRQVLWPAYNSQHQRD